MTPGLSSWPGPQLDLVSLISEALRWAASSAADRRLMSSMEPSAERTARVYEMASSARNEALDDFRSGPLMGKLRQLRQTVTRLETARTDAQAKAQAALEQAVQAAADGLDPAEHERAHSIACVLAQGYEVQLHAAHEALADAEDAARTALQTAVAANEDRLRASLHERGAALGGKLTAVLATLLPEAQELAAVRHLLLTASRARLELPD